MSTSFLRIEHVWHDDDMLEVKVTGSTGRFAGVTDVYTTPRAIRDLAKGIERFPRSASATFTFNAGGEGEGRSVALAFSRRGSSGHVAVLFTLQNGTDRVQSELIVEPAAIDRFHAALLALSQRASGSAELEGVNA